jgi:hypothetical protein
MSVTTVSPPAAGIDSAASRFVIDGIRWDAYVAICDALEDHSGVRLIYHDGKLIFIEVEASHSADEAIAAWGRLGVPEVWRFDAAAFTCAFWNRGGDGSYEQVARSKFLPALDPADVNHPMRLAIELGSSRWYRQLETWVRDVIRPRLKGGAS